MLKVGGEQGIGALVMGLSEGADRLNKMVTMTNIFTNLLDKTVQATIQFAKAQDAAASKLETNVGNAKLYSDQIANITAATARYGTTIEDVNSSFMALKKGLAGFESFSNAQKTALATTTTQLTKLGIAEDDLVKTQDVLIKGMGMTVQQTTDLQKSLYATANAMGLPPKQVAADFAKAAPQLAAHGKNMTKVFLDLQNNAKNTGIAFDRLLSITQKFDTFEGAADSAGKLNAILGGDYLNSIDLLNATEGERVKILQESLKASGKSIDMMSKQEQLATAQALGLSDVSELQKLMNNETAKGTVEAIKAEKAQKQMNEVTKQAVSLQDKINSLFMKLAINMRPVIEAAKDVVDFFIQWSEALGRVYDDISKQIQQSQDFVALFDDIKIAIDSVKSIWQDFSGWLEYYLGKDGGMAAKGLMVIVGLFAGLKLALFLLSLPFKLLGNSIGGAVNNVSKSAAQAIGRVGGAANKNKGGILALGAAFLMMGAGIGIAALGMAKLVASFAGLTGGQILGALGAVVIVMGSFILLMYAMIPAITELGVAGAAVAVPLLALGAALLLIGGAIALASYGLSLLVKAITPLAQIIVGGLVDGLKAVGDIIKTLSTMSASNLLAMGPALLAIAGGIMALSAAGAGSAITGAFTGAVSGIAGFFGGKTAAATTNPLDMLRALADIAKTFPTSEIQKIADAIDKLIASLSKTVASNLVDTLNNVKTMVEEINKVDTAKVTAMATIMSTPAPTAATKPAAATTTTTSTGTNIVPVAIYIDGKKVGEILDPQIKKTIQASLKKINGRMVPNPSP